MLHWFPKHLNMLIGAVHGGWLSPRDHHFLRNSPFLSTIYIKLLGSAHLTYLCLEQILQSIHSCSETWQECHNILLLETLRPLRFIITLLKALNNCKSFAWTASQCPEHLFPNIPSSISEVPNGLIIFFIHIVCLAHVCWCPRSTF